MVCRHMATGAKSGATTTVQLSTLRNRRALPRALLSSVPAITLRRREDKQLLELNRLEAACFGLIAGYVNANTKIRFDTFGGMMTGNTVNFAIRLQTGQTAMALATGSLLLAFVIGGGVTLVLVNKLGRKGSLFMPPLLLGGALVLCDVLQHAYPPSPDDADAYTWMRARPAFISTLVAFAMGGQNVVSSRGIAANSTFLTGCLKRLTEAFYSWADGTMTEQDKKPTQILAAVWLSNFCGAVLGAVFAASLQMHDWSLCPVAAFMAVLVFWERYKDPTRLSSPSSKLGSKQVEISPTISATSGHTDESLAEEDLMDDEDEMQKTDSHHSMEEVPGKHKTGRSMNELQSVAVSQMNESERLRALEYEKTRLRRFNTLTGGWNLPLCDPPKLGEISGSIDELQTIVVNEMSEAEQLRAQYEKTRVRRFNTLSGGWNLPLCTSSTDKEQDGARSWSALGAKGNAH
jgi:uncharacterized membrane protein YoaK (UPF0700 family)